MNRNTVLIVGAAALVGYYLYKKSQTQALIQTASPSVVVPDMLVGWIAQIPAQGQTNFQAALPQMSQSELSNMAANLTTLSSGQPLSAAQQATWNAWTSKYHIQDGSY